MVKQVTDPVAKIWCLFSIDNNYDQPDNNLVCWWSGRPSIETLSSKLGIKLGEDDETTVNLVKIWQGKQEQIRTGDTAYRLQEVGEGQVLEGGV